MIRAEALDRMYEDYLTLAEYRDHVGSARPSITGYVSECCGSETRDKRGDIACVNCGRRCSTRSWYSPLSGGAAKGGWDPGRNNGLAAHGPADQIMYVNETRSRRVHTEDGRRVAGFERIRSLGRLFDARPTNWDAADWRRSLLAWKRWLSIRDAEEVARLSRLNGEGDEWTRDAVVAWIRNARTVVSRRLEVHPGRYQGVRLAA